MDMARTVALVMLAAMALAQAMTMKGARPDPWGWSRPEASKGDVCDFGREPLTLSKKSAPGKSGTGAVRRSA